MNPSDLVLFFEDRSGEVNAYLDFLEELQKATQGGVPRLAGTEYRITALQQKILYSSVYLQLYNLVEATITQSLEAVAKAAEETGAWQPHQLSEQLHREWVRAMARTHSDMAPENRLKFALQLSDHLFNQLPIAGFNIEVGGGGNWDDESIFQIGKRLGCLLQLSPEALKMAKKKMRDDLGPLKLVKDRRNGLAHGSISFVSCADGLDFAELHEMAQSVISYLGEVVTCFADYVISYGFLRPEARPAGGA